MNEEKRVAAVGILLIACGIVMNPMLLGFVFSPTGKMVSIPHILFVIIGELLLLAVGIWSYLVRRRLSIKGILLRAMGLCMILLSAEVGLHIARPILNLYRGAAVDKRLSLSFYQNKPWADELFKEYHETKLGFDQYTGWKTEEYRGSYINVDGQGSRMTINPAAAGGGPDTVFMFGGSLIWGAYVRDEGTIPSLLSKDLAERGMPRIVVNFAERGYTFTQGVLRLILLLKDGRRPSTVIFCDGLNDIVSAHYNCRAGVFGLYSELKSTVEDKRLPHRKQFAILVTDFLEKESMLYKVADRLAVFFFEPRGQRKYDQQQLGELSSGIVREYTAALSLLDSVSRVYRFMYMCFLQPVIYTKQYVTEEERQSDPLASDPEMRELDLLTYGSLEHSSLQHWYSLSHILDGRKETFYSDVCHLSEDGNQLVAAAMLNHTFDGLQ